VIDVDHCGLLYNNNLRETPVQSAALITTRRQCFFTCEVSDRLTLQGCMQTSSEKLRPADLASSQ
jgi:hypothetical protein